MPLVKGGIAVVAIWEYIYVWGEYLITLTLIDFPELETLSIAVTKLQGWGAHFTSSILAGYGDRIRRLCGGDGARDPGLYRAAKMVCPRSQRRHSQTVALIRRARIPVTGHTKTNRA